MTRIKNKRYTVSEETKRQENFYHLKKAFRALNSNEWCTSEEVMYELRRNGYDL